MESESSPREGVEEKEDPEHEDDEEHEEDEAEEECLEELKEDGEELDLWGTGRCRGCSPCD